MTQIAIGEAVGEGFGLIAKRPGAILVWGLARTLVFAGFFLMLAPFYLEIFERAASGISAPPDIGQLMSLQAVIWLMSLAAQFVCAVVYCAALRAVIHPDQDAWAYVRVGSAELFLFLLIFGGAIVIAIGFVILFVPLAILAAIAFAAHAAAVGSLLMVAAGLAAIVLMAWLFCRLSMAAPMMVEDGKFHLTDAWVLTRGHFWPLFWIAMLLIVILLAVEVFVGGVGMLLGVGYVLGTAGGPEGVKALFARDPAAILNALAPIWIVCGLVAIPLFGALNAIIMAPWARAYRNLRPAARVADVMA